MSNTKKWVIGIGIVAALCLAACGVLSLVFWQAGSQVARSIKTDPTDVAQLGAKIADFDVPPGYVQSTGMSILMYDFVTYMPSENSGGMMIMLMQFRAGSSYSSEQMQQVIEEQSGQSGASLVVVKSYQTTIRGQKSTVVIEDGTTSGTSGITIRELLTTFPGKNGTVMLMISGPKATWDQALADQFIGSIR